MAEHVPSVGRMVHYVAYGPRDGEHHAAIVTEVWAYDSDVHNPGEPSSVLSLCVLARDGISFVVGVYHDPTGTQPGTWHWPEPV